VTSVKWLVRGLFREPASATKSRAATASGVDYEGAWSEYARDWRKRFPSLRYLGDEWNGTESGAATSVEEYTELIRDRFVSPYIEKTDTVLEIGVGGGRTAVLLKEFGGDLVCADISREMLEATRSRLGDDGVTYVKLNGRTLNNIPAGSVDVCFCFDTMVHIESRDIFNYLYRIPKLMRGKRTCIFHHSNILSERGWQRFLKEWDKNLMGVRHGRSFSVMTDEIMQKFLDHLGYEVIVKDLESVPRDCVWVVRAPAV